MAFFMSIFGITIQDKTYVKAEEKSNPSTLWVIGDSTVSAFNDTYYYPRYGYGTQLQQYFNIDNFKVENLALSGRSSKSYIEDAEYKTLKDGMKAGDYLIIGFGHNDEKTEVSRYTNPNGSYEDEGSFANSLYKNYIEPATKVGCKVVLCTPIVRRTADGNWTNANLHVTSTAGEFEGGDYAEAIRKLGKELDIPVIDMTSLTKSLYDKLGPSETLNLHAWTSSDPSSVDNTHTNIWGGRYNAYLVAKTVKELNVDTLSDAVLTDKIANAPIKADNLVKNPDYVEVVYDSNLKDSEMWQDFGIWKGTVFGNVGGVISKDNFSLGSDADGNMNIAVSGNKGKIASTVDGIAMYYYKVPSSSTFTLTAKAKINSITKNNQVSFGLMARDDMYIDENITSTMGDYVAAAPLNITTAGAWNCFARKSGVLTQGGTISNTSLEPGSIVDLKIQSNSDGYACTFGNEEAITGGFDFALTKVDSKNVYVGMFAARNADVTFSDIKLVVDGKEVTASLANEPEMPKDDVNKGEETEVPKDDVNKDEETETPKDDGNKGEETETPKDDVNKGEETEISKDDVNKVEEVEASNDNVDNAKKTEAPKNNKNNEQVISNNSNKSVKTADPAMIIGYIMILAFCATALASSRKKAKK
ncbi:MAG: carbohydrate esterase family 12 protein [Clostridium sp.]|nr:carbohydrate esterase family 12 protein [Clostridium sp.]